MTLSQVVCSAGTPLDSRTMDMEPVSVTLTNTCVIAANASVLYLWQYKVGVTVRDSWILVEWRGDK